jgi:hypothetical protein
MFNIVSSPSDILTGSIRLLSATLDLDNDGTATLLKLGIKVELPELHLPAFGDG